MLICTYRTPETAASAAVFVKDLRVLDSTAEVVVLDLCQGLGPIDGAVLLDPVELGGDLPQLALIASDARELATFLTPSVALWALVRNEHVVFAAPETIFLTSPRSLVDQVDANGLLLLCRIGRALREDGLLPTPRDVLARGVVNERLFACTSVGREALAWWRDRQRAREIVRRGPSAEDHPVLQRSEFVPRLPWADALGDVFDATVLTDSGWAESAWTLGSESTTVHALDLDGIDPARAWLPHRDFAAAPRFRWSQHPELWPIAKGWLARVAAETPEVQPRGQFDQLSDGTPVDAVMRRTYRTAIRNADDAPRDPFSDDGGTELLEWLAAPAPNSRLSRYLQTIWSERIDLQLAYPNAARGDADAFEGWVRAFGASEERVPDLFLPSEAAEPTTQAAPGSGAGSAEQSVTVPGVLVSGYFRSVMGLGEAARLVAEAVDRSGVPGATYTYSAAAAQQADEFVERGDHTIPYETHVACVNIDTFLDFANDLGPTFFDGRYTIGLWFWETSVVPERMLPAFDLVDEIWVAAEYVGSLLRPYTDKPIRVFPQPVPIPERGECSRAELGLPDDFTFLFAFDFNSILERKNPLAIVRAFREAFEPGTGPKLVLKTINASKHVEAYEQLALATMDHPDITIVDGFFPTWKRDAWTAACDCYISLHRSEGFGLTMAEAMASGKPVIATRFSANLEFMNDDNSLLVDASEARVPAGCAPYPEGAIWAAPDEHQAAEHMRRIYTDPELRERLGAAGRRTITEQFTRQAMSDWVAKELKRPRTPRSTTLAAATGRRAALKRLLRSRR